MTIRNLLLTLWMAGTLAAQSFIQIADPQFGMYSKNANFEHETVNFEFAIATANRLKPAFATGRLRICFPKQRRGAGDFEKRAESKRACTHVPGAVPLVDSPQP